MNKAVLEYLLCEKRAFTKLNDVTYPSFKLRPYLATKIKKKKKKKTFILSQVNVTHPKITSGE